MPRLPKKTQIRQKTLVLAIFGPRAPSGPISALFPGVGRCAAGWREALITLVPWSTSIVACAFEAVAASGKG